MERARGVRIAWEEIPLRVRRAIEERLGSNVVEARNQEGGFSPGLAARVLTASGDRVFLKAISPLQNPDSPGIYRQEAYIAGALPEHSPTSQLLWIYDEGDDGWVVLAFVDVEGKLPAIPWRRDELERVVEAIAAMHEALTPSPIALEPIAAELETDLRGWATLRGDEAGLDDWSRRHLATLTRLEDQAPGAARGNTMLHVDLRADNILLTNNDVVIVDWPNAAAGAPWVDMIGMAPSVTLEGGPEPEEFIALHPAARSADPHQVNAVLASIAGYFTHRSLQSPPPGLPTVRAFQAAQGEIARRWLADRLGLK